MTTSPAKSLIALAFGLSSLVTFQPVAANNGLRTVAPTGGAAPSTGAGVSFNTFANIDAAPVLNNSGQAAFTRHLSGTGGFANDSGIWSEGGGSGLAPVAREGTIAPGTTVGFGDFYGDQILMNGTGKTAVYAGLDTSQSGVNSTNFRGIWSEGHGSGLAFIARSGNPAPGTSSGISTTTLLISCSIIAGKRLLTAHWRDRQSSDPIIRGVWSEGAAAGSRCSSHGQRGRQVWPLE